MHDQLVAFANDELVGIERYHRVTDIWTVGVSVAVYRCLGGSDGPDQAAHREIARRAFAFSHWFDSYLDDPTRDEATPERVSHLLAAIDCADLDAITRIENLGEALQDSAILLVNATASFRDMRRTLTRSARDIVEASGLKAGAATLSQYVRVLRLEAATSSTYFLAPFDGLGSERQQRFCRRILLAAIYLDASQDMVDDARESLITLSPSWLMRARLALLGMSTWSLTVASHPRSAVSFYRGGFVAQVRSTCPIFA